MKMENYLTSEGRLKDGFYRVTWGNGISYVVSVLGFDTLEITEIKGSYSARQCINSKAKSYAEGTKFEAVEESEFIKALQVCSQEWEKYFAN